MNNKLNKNKILNILALFFGGIFSIPILGAICLIIINILSYNGIDTNIVIGSSIISSIEHKVSFGPLMVVFAYLLGMIVTYIYITKQNKKRIK